MSLTFEEDRCEENFSTNKLNIDDLKIDLENWMGKLPESLKCVPLIYIAIPGKLF